jgi:AcrR family transcriptional regulator
VKKRPSPDISTRKRPLQARSTQLVADILEAAVRVLIRDGARRFTTARVAETAGVSVGSLYQYFPNKEAILFQLQMREWEQTSGQMSELLSDPDRPPLERVRRTIRHFFRTEYEEAALRLALDDALSLYRDAPEIAEHENHKKHIRTQTIKLLAEALPHTTSQKRSFIADLILTTLSSTGETVSSRAGSLKEMDRWSDGLADMVCAYIEQFAEADG